MREITMKVYKLNELNEGVKVKVINDYRQVLSELRNQDLEAYLLSILENDHNLKDFELDYSLSYSQGDGVCFYNGGINALSYIILKNGDYNNANAFEKYIMDNYSGEEFEVILSYLNEGNSIFVDKVYYNYSHLNTCEIRYEFDCIYNDVVDKIIQNLCDNLKIYVYNPICKELEKSGYNFMKVNDEEVVEFIEDNEYEFFENGEIYVG